MPTNDGHPVKRVQYATEVNHDKTQLMEFRDEALALAERLGMPAAAKELELYASQLYGWRVKVRAELSIVK